MKEIKEREKDGERERRKKRKLERGVNAETGAKERGLKVLCSEY
jgi:hypothetical protein